MQYPDHPREEFYPAGRLKVSLLQQVFLCFALVGCLFVFCRLHFFHQVAFAVTVQPRPVAVLAKPCGDIMPVKLETRINKEARKAAAYEANNKQQCRDAVFHEAKVAMYFLVATEISFLVCKENEEACSGQAYNLYTIDQRIIDRHPV